MILRKITTDNSVRYVRQSEETQERDNKTNTITKNSLRRRQKQNISKIKIKFIEAHTTGEGFRLF